MLLHYLLWQRRCLGAKPDSTTLDKKQNKQKNKKSGKKGKEKKTNIFVCLGAPEMGLPKMICLLHVVNAFFLAALPKSSRSCIYIMRNCFGTWVKFKAITSSAYAFKGQHFCLFCVLSNNRTRRCPSMQTTDKQRKTQC